MRTLQMYCMKSKILLAMKKVDIAVLRPEEKRTNAVAPYLNYIMHILNRTKHMMRLPVMQYNKSFAFHCDLAAIS